MQPKQTKIKIWRILWNINIKIFDYLLKISVAQYLVKICEFFEKEIHPL